MGSLGCVYIMFGAVWIVFEQCLYHVCIVFDVSLDYLDSVRAVFICLDSVSIVFGQCLGKMINILAK